MTANAYISIDDADRYFAELGDPAEWRALNEAQKRAAIRVGSQYVDLAFRERWKGRRASRSQELAWPRSGVVDIDGYHIRSDEVPSAVRYAAAEAALRHARGISLLPDELSSGEVVSETLQVGEFRESTTYANGRSSMPVFPAIERLLAGLVSASGFGVAERPQSFRGGHW